MFELDLPLDVGCLFEEGGGVGARVAKPLVPSSCKGGGLVEGWGKRRGKERDGREEVRDISRSE